MGGYGGLGLWWAEGGGVGAGGGCGGFDAVRGGGKGGGGSWDDPVYGLRPLNGSAEVGTVGLRPWLARLLPTEVAQIADALANPQPFDKATLWRTYADGEYRSF